MNKNETNFLEKIFLSASNDLDLADSKYEEAIRRYDTIASYLIEPLSAISEYNPSIYPQGSFRLGTIVRPLTSCEYDIDLVCVLDLENPIGQNDLFNLIGDRLNEKYSTLIEAKRRCWRIKYANEFHMDILPAILVNKNNNEILIPDKELKEWQHSNPKDYVEWFFQQMATARSKLLLIEKAEVESVPFYKYKTPLQRSIQILKRHRDNMFIEYPEDMPISIIITTLAAELYENEDSIIITLMNFIEKSLSIFKSKNGVIEIHNPINKNENFADKWKESPIKQEKFILWLEKLKKDIEDLLRVNDKDDFNNNLKKNFGYKSSYQLLEKNEEIFDNYMNNRRNIIIPIDSPPKPWKCDENL